jgi:MarR family transcriptional regulator, temperature-dependent positive regulator of motility
MDDSTIYHLLKQLTQNPAATQRELAGKAGISLGKVNFCLHALADKGLIKAGNFKKSRNKSGYLYHLTPRGMEEKARVTVRFLRRKMEEYDRLPREIEELRADIREHGLEVGDGGQ